MPIISSTVANELCTEQHLYKTNGLCNSTSRMHCVYSYNDGVDDQIGYRSSDDKGATWSARTTLTADVYGANSEQYPSVVSFANGDILVVWSGKSAASVATFQIRYCYFTFATSTWSAPADITSAVATYNQYTNQGRTIAMDSVGDVHLVYMGYDEAGIAFGTGIKYRKFTFATGLWSVATTLWLEATMATYPVIAVGPGDILHVSAARDGGGRLGIYYMQNNAGWQPEELVMLDTNENSLSDIMVDTAGVAHVAWCGGVGGSAVFQLRYKNRTVPGVWSAVADLTAEVADQMPCSITRDLAGDIHIIWAGPHPGSGGLRQIRKITYTGGAWGGITNFGVNGSNAPYVLGGYNRGYMPQTGYKFIYFDGTDGDVEYYGDATDGYSGPLTLTAFVHPTGQAGYSPPPSPRVRETGEM